MQGNYFFLFESIDNSLNFVKERNKRLFLRRIVGLLVDHSISKYCFQCKEKEIIFSSHYNRCNFGLRNSISLLHQTSTIWKFQWRPSVLALAWPGSAFKSFGELVKA